MVDASFAEVPRQRNSREDNATIKAGTVPQAFQDHHKIKAHKDLDARWTKKNHKTHYGDKGHVKVDVRDKLILNAVVTAAHVHDSQVLDELIEEGDIMVYADSAYQSAAIDAALTAKTSSRRSTRKAPAGIR